MAFWRLVGLWVISGNVSFGQHWPSYVVTRFYGFYPHLLDWISADCVHPFDGFLFGWQVVDAMCQLDLPSCCLRGSVWLPFSVVLGQWYPVSITFISFADDNGISLTCDETCSSPRRHVHSHSLVCNENPFSIVGIGPIPVKEL